MTANWLIAYDATCGTCRKISRIVRQASADKLDVVPLDRPAVRQWRQRALGADPPWKPTLLRVDGHQVRAWTGVGIAWPLVCRLGPRTTVDVVYALGNVRPSTSVWRRLIGGGVVAGSLLLTGKAPITEARERADARRWVRRHRDRLPRTYDEITAFPPAYRIEIFAASSPEVQSHFWVEAIKRDRESRRDLTDTQHLVYEEALALATVTEVFRPPLEPELSRRLDDLHHQAVREFSAPAEHGIFLKFGRARS